MYVYIYIDTTTIIIIYITLCVYTYTRTQNEVLWKSQTPSDLQSQPKFASIHIYIYTVLYTSCRHNSHHAAKGISCVAGAVKNTRQTCNSACT